jgi:nicotinamidase-related amidase
MRHENLLDLDRAVLIVCDLQEKFRAVIDQFESVAMRTAIVAEAAKLLGVPVIVTEQSPEKLGRTVEEVRRVLPADVTPFDKTAFSCCGAEGFSRTLHALKRPQVMLAGIEAHVCMNQTAHDLLAQGYFVHLLTDCTSSRTAANRELGISKMLGSGAQPSSSEMAVFELMRDATHEQFRNIQKLIK